MWKRSDPACAARHEENGLLIELLPQELVELESRMARLRWSGYQFMSPLECTRQFASDYKAQFQSTFFGACDFDPDIGTRDFETLWRMRLAADDCMMSYRLYLHIGFHLYRRRDPEPFRRPHLIFAKRQESVTWKRYEKKALVEYGPTIPSPASMSQYHRPHYHGLPVQDAFRRRIINNAAGEGWGRSAAKYVLQYPVLRPKELIAGLAGDARAAAISEMKAERDYFHLETKTKNLEPSDLLQTCFAWPRRRGREDECASCPQDDACAVPVRPRM